MAFFTTCASLVKDAQVLFLPERSKRDMLLKAQPWMNAQSGALTRIGHEIVERNKGTDNLVLVGVLPARRSAGRGAEPAHRRARRRRSRPPVRRTGHRAVTATTSPARRAMPGGAGRQPALQAGRRQDGGAGGRRDLHRPHGRAPRWRLVIRLRAGRQRIRLAVLVDRGPPRAAHSPRSSSARTFPHPPKR